MKKNFSQKIKKIEFKNFELKNNKKNKFKNLFLSVFLNLVLMFFVVFSGHYVAVKILSQNKFFVKHIAQIKAQENIFDKTVRVLEQDSLFAIKKYFEIAIDAFIGSEKMTSVADVKNFFLLIFNYIDEKILIQNLEKKDDRYILTCQGFFASDEEKKSFSQKLQTFDYVKKIDFDISQINDIFVIEMQIKH